MVDRDLRTEPNGLRTRLERNRRKPARRAEGETGKPRTGQAKACRGGAEGEAGNLNSARPGLDRRKAERTAPDRTERHAAEAAPERKLRRTRFSCLEPDRRTAKSGPEKRLREPNPGPQDTTERTRETAGDKR